MKKLILKISKALGIGVIAVVLVTIGIDASDHFDNMSESIVGKLFSNNDGPCPEDMVYIPSGTGGFCIDIYESSPSEDCPYSNPLNQSETRSNLDLDGCKSVSEKGVLPWLYISQTQAQVACAKAGKRLAIVEE